MIQFSCYRAETLHPKSTIAADEIGKGVARNFSADKQFFVVGLRPFG